MGSMSDDWLDNQNEKAQGKLAQHLGITKDELDEYGNGIQEQTGNDDMIYGYYLQFKEETPEHVLSRIKDIDSNKTVYFQHGDLEKIYEINGE